ncbi:Asparagine-rich protein [Plasmodium coatneyi]|uniref:Asparagine-rich protein n=1 Tax=Plasmodium coatneyi TaxID=208452 RepID=A0A1B1DU09_9APIC|nr:Asparagine-rich protein [Plasmodium coatneyi]ANQ06271.1 Asparagine-rich protein [Plasmodium coatneyi]
MENKNFSQNIFYKGFNERRVNYLNVNANTDFENAHSVNVSSGVTPLKNTNEENSLLKMNAQKVSDSRQAGNTKINQGEFVGKIQSHVNLNNMHSNAPYANGGLLYVDNKMGGGNVNSHIYSNMGTAPSGLNPADGSARKNIFNQGIYPDVKGFDRVDANRMNMNTFSNSRNVPMKSGEYIFSGAQQHLGYMDSKEVSGKGGPPVGGSRVGSNPISGGNVFGGHILGTRGKENQMGAYLVNPVSGGGPMPTSGKSAAAYEGGHSEANRVDSMMKDGLFGSMYRTIQGGTNANVNTNSAAVGNAQSSLSNFINGGMARNNPPVSDTAMNQVPFQTPDNLSNTKNPNLKIFDNQGNKLKDVDASNMSTNLSQLNQLGQLRQKISFSNFTNTVSSHHHRVNNNQSFNHIGNFGNGMNKLDTFNVPPAQGSNSMNKGTILNSTLLTGTLNSNGMSIPGMNLSNGGNLPSYGKHSMTNPLSGNALGMEGGGSHFAPMGHDSNQGNISDTHLAGIPMANAPNSGNLISVGNAHKGISEGHLKSRGNLINYGYLHNKGKVGEVIGMGTDGTNSNYGGMNLFGGGVPHANGLHYVNSMGGPINLKSNSEKVDLQREGTVLKGGVPDGGSALTRGANQCTVTQTAPNNNVISTDNYANLLKHLCTPIKSRLASNTTDRLNSGNIGEYANQEGKFPGEGAKGGNISAVHESVEVDMFVGSGAFKGSTDEGKAQESTNLGNIPGAVDFNGDADIVRKDPLDNITSMGNAVTNIGGGVPSWGHVYDLKKMNRFAEKKRRDEETAEVGCTNSEGNGQDGQDQTHGDNHNSDLHHEGKNKPTRSNRNNRRSKSKTKVFFYLNPKYIIEPLKRKIYQNMSLYIENLISDVQVSENKNRGEILADLHNTPWFCMVFDFDGISKLLNVFNKYLIYSDSLIIPDVLIGRKMEGENTSNVFTSKPVGENQQGEEHNYDPTQKAQGTFHHYFKKSEKLNLINKKINEYEHSIIESAEKLSYLKELCTSIKGQIDTKKKKLLLLMESAKLKLFAYKSKELQTILDIEKKSEFVTKEEEQINLTEEYYDMFKKINDGLHFLKKYSNVVISTQSMHEEITHEEENKHLCQSSVSTEDLSCENNLNGHDNDGDECDDEDDADGDDDDEYEEEEEHADQHSGEGNYPRNDHISNMHMSPGKRKKRRKKRNGHEVLLQRKNPTHDEFDDKADKEVNKKRKTVNQIKNLQWEKEDNEEWVDEFLEDF